ncbi:hypothetical protein CEXT_534001 [Caerostris extrusa]|uniref:Uncharacterized protein n=1 Tax=Caerostris extrusa TaxID=172846 RepID=A0AAV4P4F7_CAEEX|nr:hypothetical protein CEXT_534001 [Caerostris extrusa]
MRPRGHGPIAVVFMADGKGERTTTFHFLSGAHSDFIAAFIPLFPVPLTAVMMPATASQMTPPAPLLHASGLLGLLESCGLQPVKQQF